MPKHPRTIDLTGDAEDVIVIDDDAPVRSFGQERTAQDEEYYQSLAKDRSRKEAAKTIQRRMRSVLKRRKTRAAVRAREEARHAAAMAAAKPTSAADRRELMAKAAEKRAKNGGRRTRR
jgi:hypothetical protein